jgi:8-oxo-dGTP diphosphatase
LNGGLLVNGKWVVAPKVLIKGPSGLYLFVQRSSKSRHFASQWEVPGGKPDAGEDIDECLIRETKEETGLDLTLTGVAGAGEGRIPNLNLAYMFMEGTVDSEAVILSDEHDDFKWISLEDARQLDLFPAFKLFIEKLTSY